MVANLVLSAGRGAPASAGLGVGLGEGLGACRGDRASSEPGWPREIACSACANSGGTAAPERRNVASWSMLIPCAQMLLISVMECLCSWEFTEKHVNEANDTQDTK